jgi:predicted alpha/beta hydrolase family esterase
MRAFLILHGWDNFRPAGHWQRELATSLRQRGERVVYPQLPEAARPRLDAWREAAGSALRDAAGGDARVTVIAHSLGAALWLGARPADPAEEAAVERVLLAAPPSPGFLRQNPEVAEFAELTPSRPAADTLIVASDDDPCCPEGAAVVHGRPLGIPVVTIPGGGHLTPASGYGEWPSMLEWCLDPSAVIRPR